jgi:AraC-like DNA-binding protein
MQKLIETTKNIIKEHQCLPFSVYSSSEEQHIVNVPIIKPLLVFVLAGSKKIGAHSEVICNAGSFVFLSNSSTVAIRNIPRVGEYFAIIIEYDYSDFNCLEHRKARSNKPIQGQINDALKYTLQQFVEWSAFAPTEMWFIRRQEILKVLFHLGFEGVSSIMEPPTLTQKLHTLISANISKDLSIRTLSSMLAMSESTLRRKLNAEGSSLQSIKDRVRLGYGLHLVQTSLDSIGCIAEGCGYSSQSRFTEKFKQIFGVTPTELRKTRMSDLGE